MKVTFQVQDRFRVSAKKLYIAWLSAKEHAKMTGGEATCEAVVGGDFSAWDGYITGKIISLIPNQEIVQTWRTTEFSENDEDSEVTIQFVETNDGCDVILTHKNIPAGQPDYAQGWEDYYFTPMTDYFEGV
jgi:activator of HSP90 ATPase